MLVSTRPGFPDTPIAQIPLQNGMWALFDPKWSPIFLRHHWYAKKSRGRYYVCCKKVCCGGVHFIRMHRAVAYTPQGMICHHINGNTLDNREANLLNVTEFEHQKYFSYW